MASLIATAANVIARLQGVNKILKQIKPATTADQVLNMVTSAFPNLKKKKAAAIATRLFAFAKKMGYGSGSSAVMGGADLETLTDIERDLLTSEVSGGAGKQRRKKKRVARRNAGRVGGGVAKSQAQLF